MREIHRGRVVYSFSPEGTSHHLAVVDLSILEKHATIELQSAFEEISCIDLVFSPNDTQPTWPSLLVDKAEIS